MLNKTDYDFWDVLGTYASSQSDKTICGIPIDRWAELDRALQNAFTQCQPFADFVKDAFEYVEAHPEKERGFYE